MDSEDLSFQPARGQRPKPRQLMPKLAAGVSRRGRAAMAEMEKNACMSAV